MQGLSHHNRERQQGQLSVISGYPHVRTNSCGFPSPDWIFGTQGMGSNMDMEHGVETKTMEPSALIFMETKQHQVDSSMQGSNGDSNSPWTLSVAWKASKRNNSDTCHLGDRWQLLVKSVSAKGVSFFSYRTVLKFPKCCLMVQVPFWLSENTLTCVCIFDTFPLMWISWYYYLAIHPPGLSSLLQHGNNIQVKKRYSWL